MKAHDLRDLTLAIVEGKKNDATQIDQNLATAFVQQLIRGSADLHDAIHVNGDLYILGQEIDGSLHVLTWEKKFEPIEANEGVPLLETYSSEIECWKKSFGTCDAVAMTLDEVANFQPSTTPRV